MSASRPAARRRRRVLLGLVGVVPVLLAVAVFAAARQNAQPDSPAPAATTADQPAQHPAPGGQPAPGFTAKTLSGETFSLTDHRGEVVVVEFLAPGCPSCTVDVAGLSEAARGNPDATFLIADVSGAPNPKTLRDYYRGELEAASELLIAQDADFQVARAYGARALGHTVVITPDGRVSWKGRWSGDQERLAAQIRKATGS